MKIFKKEMSRRDFLKYVFGGALLLGLGSFGIKMKDKNKTKIKLDSGYGNGVYGG